MKGHMSDRHPVSAFYVYVLSLSLANYIFMILYDYCLHSFVTKSYKYGILNATCKSRVGVRHGKSEDFVLHMLQFQKMAVRRRRRSL
jgi:branched-subunit amino acid transport protein AzlD